MNKLMAALALLALAGCAPTYYEEGYYSPPRRYYTPRYERSSYYYPERERYHRCPRVPPPAERDNLDCRLQQDGCIKCWE